MERQHTNHENDQDESTIYKEDFVERLLEDDELSFEEAMFMTGYNEGDN